MDAFAPLPRWLRVLFVAAMLGIVLLLVWFAPSQYQLRFQLDDVALSLDTSRQREAKQQYEYDQVVAELPLTQADLDATQPLADAAKAQETALRDQRKTLRAEKKELAAALETALASATDLQLRRDALQAEVDALTLKEAELQAEVASLREKLGLND